MKGYEIIWTDGYYIRVRILNKDGAKQLEAKYENYIELADIFTAIHKVERSLK